MNKFLNVSEEHIGRNASPVDAKRVVDLLQVDAWKVVYGDAPWQFVDDVQRQDFEAAFQWAVGVMQAEKSGADEIKMQELAKQRIQQNGRLQPFAKHLLKERPWADYWRWLINTPTDVIVKWVQSENKKDVPRH